MFLAFLCAGALPRAAAADDDTKRSLAKACANEVVSACALLGAQSEDEPARAFDAYRAACALDHAESCAAAATLIDAGRVSVDADPVPL